LKGQISGTTDYSLLHRNVDVLNYVAAPELFPLNAIKDHLIELLFSYWENQE